MKKILILLFAFLSVNAYAVELKSQKGHLFVGKKKVKTKLNLYDANDKRVSGLELLDLSYAQLTGRLYLNGRSILLNITPTGLATDYVREMCDADTGESMGYAVDDVSFFRSDYRLVATSENGDVKVATVDRTQTIGIECSVELLNTEGESDPELDPELESESVPTPFVGNLVTFHDGYTTQYNNWLDTYTAPFYVK